MNSWIFQGNPDVFDINTYLIRNATISWSVRQEHFSDKMAPGDQVFLWRASGSNRAKSGIVARGSITSYPEMMEDDAASQGLWKKPPPDQKNLCVIIELSEKCIGDEEVLEKERLKEDRVLSEMRILKLHSETNYLITPEQAQRLADLLTEDVQQKETIALRKAINDDPGERQAVALRIRRGQPSFRDNLLRLYGTKCAICGHGPAEALEAVHIYAHAKSGINEVDNGILLRSDLHALFDANLIKINPMDHRVLIDDKLRETPYWQFNGKVLVRNLNGKQLSPKYLEMRWQEL